MLTSMRTISNMAIDLRRTRELIGSTLNGRLLHVVVHTFPGGRPRIGWRSPRIARDQELGWGPASVVERRLLTGNKHGRRFLWQKVSIEMLNSAI